jgi:uncharacterized protein (TIGR02147 family)
MTHVEFQDTESARSAIAKNVRIEDYRDIRAFLMDTYQQKKLKNPSFSIRSWAKQLGFKNPSLLANILRGERGVNFEVGRKLLSSLELTDQQKLYFEAMIASEFLPHEDAARFRNQLLDHVKPDVTKASLEVERFSSISEWHHLSILALFSLKSFKPDPIWISKKMRSKVSPEQALASLKLLKKIGLLTTDERGQLIRSRINPIVSTVVPNQAMRSHHRQMLQRSVESIEEQKISERDIRSTKFGLRKSDLERAKEIVQDCHRQLQQLSSSGEADEVYAYNSQLILITEPSLENH